MVQMRAWGLLVLVGLVACGGGPPEVKAGPMPEGGSFTGVFFSPQYGEMHMIQNGSSVRGEYKKDERSGKINGEVDGDLLRFEWVEEKAMVANRPIETRGRGFFRYVVDPSNEEHVIKGRWGLDEDDYNGGEWNAYKAKKREPQLSGDDSSGGESGDGDYYDEDLGSDDEGDDGEGDDDVDDLF